METRTKYLVTSATGNTGYQVALLLLEKGENVRVMSRKYGKKIAQLESMGAEVTLGHLANEVDLRSAVSGVQRVYYCHPIVAGLLHNTVMFARIAREEGIEAVVNIGQYLSELDSHHSRTTNEHKMAYDVLDNAGIGAIHVTPGWFADNIFETSLFITQLGLLPFPLGTGKSPVVSNEDIAAVAVALLQNPQGHEGKRYQPTGPKAVGTEEMLKTFSNVLGIKVRNLPMPMRLFFKATSYLGIQHYLLSQLKFYIEDFKNDVFNYEPNDIVERFTGRQADDFETITRRYFEERGLMGKTAAGQWQAIKDFFLIGFARGPGKREMKLLNT